jgi:cell division protein FtsQ
MLKTIINISFMLILVVGTIVLLAFTDMEHTTKTYKHFNVDILNPSEEAMISLDEINALITRNFGSIEGSPVLGIDIFKLERTVLANPYVSKCEVFQTIDGGLEMKVVVREPLVRIISEDGAQYYLDYNGFAMPLNPSKPSHILVANGKIKERYFSPDKSEQPLYAFPDSSALQQVFPVAWHIAQDEFLKSFIDQIFINDKEEMELVPKIGSQVILFGSAEDAREKLENLKTFYQKVMNQMDWNVYKTINLKYKNQVVCSKYLSYE